MITFNINEFRAINNAEVQLDGITVVAGENGSGKSTLSRLLYHTIKISKEYNALVRDNLVEELRDIVSALRTIIRDMQIFDRQDNRSSIRLSQLSLNLKEDEDLMDYYYRLSAHIDSIDNHIRILLDKQSNMDNRPYNKRSIIRAEHYIKLLSNLIDNSDIMLDAEIIFNKLKDIVLTKIKASIKNIEYRPIWLFRKEISSIFSQKMDDAKFNFCEYDNPITDWDNKILREPSIIQNSIYIDTPMAIGYHLDVRGYGYWNDLIYTLKNTKPNYSTSTNVETLFQNISGDNIVSGQVYFNDDIVSQEFVYKRNDGQIFNLEECATGIKAFGILQMLLRNGVLSKNTLLIIDEPEAHLHPQWIVEYARMIVLMHKLIGIKFFIASHNPDMVSAIRYIAEKEGILDSVSYYLANKTKDYSYTYESLGVDIDPIFESFNIALDRINQYGQID